MQDLCLRLSLQTGILHHTLVFSDSYPGHHICLCTLAAQEVEVNDEDIIQQLMEHSNANRSTGSTGANSESSRSHSIMQVRHCLQAWQQALLCAIEQVFTPWQYAIKTSTACPCIAHPEPSG